MYIIKYEKNDEFTPFYGTSNLLLSTALENVWPGVVEWERKCHVERDPQYGGTFDGNSCRRLLKSTDILDAIIPLEFKHFVEI